MVDSGHPLAAVPCKIWNALILFSSIFIFRKFSKTSTFCNTFRLSLESKCGLLIIAQCLLVLRSRAGSLSFISTCFFAINIFSDFCSCQKIRILFFIVHQFFSQNCITTPTCCSIRKIAGYLILHAVFLSSSVVDKACLINKSKVKCSRKCRELFNFHFVLRKLCNAFHFKKAVITIR